MKHVWKTRNQIDFSRTQISHVYCIRDKLPWKEVWRIDKESLNLSQSQQKEHVKCGVKRKTKSTAPENI